MADLRGSVFVECLAIGVRTFYDALTRLYKNNLLNGDNLISNSKILHLTRYQPTVKDAPNQHSAYLCDNGVERCSRVVRLCYGPADDYVRCAISEGLRWRGDAALIACISASRSYAGCDNIRLRTEDLAQGGSLLRRRHNAGYPRILCDLTKQLNLFGRRALYADLR